MTLSQILAEIRSAEPLLVLPGNPVRALPSGYEYRAVPAHEWAEEAKLDPDEAALAWTLASEAPDINRYPQYSVAIAEAVCNAADRKDGTKDGFVVAKVTGDRRIMVAGHFGRQGGRWCSTFQRPSHRHLRCAQLVLQRHLAGEPNLVARGATGWFDPHVQVAMHEKAPETNPEPEDLVVRWARAGREWVGPIVDESGKLLVDPWRLMLDRCVPKAKAGPALEALTDARRRWRVPRAPLAAP